MDVFSALRSREYTLMWPRWQRTMARLMEVSVRPAIVWLMRMTLDGQAAMALQAFSITLSSMWRAGLLTFSTRHCMPGSLSR